MISVILPARDPSPANFGAALAGLDGQSLRRDEWELIVVDNGSEPPLSPEREPRLATLAARLIREPAPGLTAARSAGIAAARGDVIVFVDDDNVLVPGYLAAVAGRFTASPSLGAAGGPIEPRWEEPPAAWTREFWCLLAVRDHGPEVRVARGAADARWPEFAPVGAGLAVRREAALEYLEAVRRDPRRAALDRRGAHLASGGDNDLVFTVLHGGGDVGYFPDLRLVHLLPSRRLSPAYLCRLNENIMRTWVVVLHLHGQCPWPPIPGATVALRMLRAWFRFRAWRSPAHRVRWHGAIGQFRGQADIAGLRPLSRFP